MRRPVERADLSYGMTRRLVHDEQGVALVLAIFTLLILSLTTAAVLTATAVNHRSALKASEATKAFNIAQVGLAYAEGRVYGAASTHTSPPSGSTTFNQDGWTGTYASSVAGDGHTWTMTGTGTVDGITRTISSTANVPSAVTVTDSGVWNYLYADSTSGACPTTISGSTIVNVPTFVRGNLCLSATFTGAQLEVGGNLTVTGGGGKIGTVGSPTTTLKVGGTCSNGTLTATAGTGICDGHTSPIYATNVGTGLDVNPGLPPLNMSSTYNSANPGPGPGHGCQVGSGVPSPFFDSDSTLNNSVASVNLFPATSYDCVNGSYEIKWTAATSTLYVNGTFLFDGSLSLSGNSHVVYSGQGTIYFTGTITTAGNYQVCGIVNCTTSWNPDTSGIVLVAACWANSTGSALVSLATTGNYCVNYGGSNVIQVGTYCATDFHISGNSSNMGPVLANTLALAGNNSTLIPFHIMPPGTPLNTATSYLPASAPSGWAG